MISIRQEEVKLWNPDLEEWVSQRGEEINGNKMTNVPTAAGTGDLGSKPRTAKILAILAKRKLRRSNGNCSLGSTVREDYMRNVDSRPSSMSTSQYFQSDEGYFDATTLSSSTADRRVQDHHLDGEQRDMTNSPTLATGKVQALGHEPDEITADHGDKGILSCPTANILDNVEADETPDPADKLRNNSRLSLDQYQGAATPEAEAEISAGGQSYSSSPWQQKQNTSTQGNLRATHANSKCQKAENFKHKTLERRTYSTRQQQALNKSTLGTCPDLQEYASEPDQPRADVLEPQVNSTRQKPAKHKSSLLETCQGSLVNPEYQEAPSGMIPGGLPNHDRAIIHGSPSCASESTDQNADGVSPSNESEDAAMSQDLSSATLDLQLQGAAPVSDDHDDDYYEFSRENIESNPSWRLFFRRQIEEDDRKNRNIGPEIFGPMDPATFLQNCL